MAEQTYDYVIVGGGTAGLVLAARLSETGQKKILVLEAGDDAAADPRIVTPALWPSLLNSDSDWAYRTTPQTELDGREMNVPQGRLLGGSSGLNGLAFTPTSRLNVEAWAKLGSPGWDWNTMSKYFQKSYTVTKPSDAAVNHLQLDYIDDNIKGIDGPIQVSFPDEPKNVWARAWLDTLGSLGQKPSGDPFNGEAQGAYVNAESVHPTSKTRSYAGNVYLDIAKNNGNVTVFTKAAVEKLLLEKSGTGQISVQGVQFSKDGRVETVKCQEAILTAGTLNSPRLLELSGIGDSKLLASHGIPVVIDNPNVGENLQNHPMTTISFEVNDGLETIDPIARQEAAALGAAMDAYGKTQSGPFAHSGTFASAQLPLPGIKTGEAKAEIDQLVKDVCASVPATKNEHLQKQHLAFVKEALTSPNEASGYLISFPGYAAFAGDGSMAPPPADGGNYFSIAVMLTHPLSTGSSHVTSKAMSDPPKIDPRYLTHPLDIEILAKHLRFAENTIVNSDPLKGFLKPQGRRQGAPPSFDSDEAAKDYLRRHAVGAHHFSGTCAMMPKELGGVVDHELRVYGCQNLRVCDASIIPFVPRTNPQSTVYAIAERAADLIKGN